MVPSNIMQNATYLFIYLQNYRCVNFIEVLVTFIHSPRQCISTVCMCKIMWSGVILIVLTID